MSLRELDARQKLLAAVALLLILAHLFFPSAGVDDTSIILLVFLAVVLYGNELTAWLAEFQTLAAEPRRARSTPSQPERAEPEPSEPEQAEPSEPEPAERPRTQSDLSARVRQVAYQVEHARVAASTEDLPNGGLSREVLDRIVERSAGEPRAALLLLWSALEERMRAATGARDSVWAARRLVEGGRAPVQFADAFDAFRKLRNDVAQATQGEVDEAAIWSIVDIGASLMALVPDAVSEESPERSWVP